nr:hypothetical protein [Marseillevirus cajuinensis]
MLSLFPKMRKEPPGRSLHIPKNSRITEAIRQPMYEIILAFTFIDIKTNCSKEDDGSYTNGYFCADGWKLRDNGNVIDGVVIGDNLYEFYGNVCEKKPHLSKYLFANPGNLKYHSTQKAPVWGC